MPYADGTCRGCGSELEDDDGTRCKSCAAKRRQAATELRDHRREHGLCLTCGQPVAKSKIVGSPADGHRSRALAAYCAVHLAYYAARQRTG